MSADSRGDPHSCVGWDIGGAHLKAGLVMNGRVVAAAQVPCRLWRGVAALDEAIVALPDWARAPGRHAVTMTGELCDFFPDRATGVAVLVQWAAEHLSPDVGIYGGRSGFLSVDDVANHAVDIASANWHATASLIGVHVDEALLVDIGSTTTDLIPVAGGKPVAAGYTDAERLATAELVYTGIVRTPLMALARHVPFAGRTTGIMAEYFATTADVYRLLGRLTADADQQEPADAHGKSLDETRVRLARMIGRDAADAPPAAWRQLARHFAELQLRHVQDGALQVLSRAPLTDGAPIVTCGVGGFIARELARRLDRPCRDIAGLCGMDAEVAFWGSSCAPAVAVALLTHRRFSV